MMVKNDCIWILFVDIVCGEKLPLSYTKIYTMSDLCSCVSLQPAVRGDFNAAIRGSLKPAVRGEINAAVRGSPKSVAICSLQAHHPRGTQRRRPYLTQARRPRLTQSRRPQLCSVMSDFKFKLSFIVIPLHVWTYSETKCRASQDHGDCLS